MELNLLQKGMRREVVEIGGYEWGGDVLRTEVNENNDYFKVYFVRTDL